MIEQNTIKLTIWPIKKDLHGIMEKTIWGSVFSFDGPRLD